MLSLFPSPYPDEILYSVLCRYHRRRGEPSARRTNIEMWGKIYGKRLYLPDGIEHIAEQIPLSANFTAERFIADTTIFPLLKPFLTQDKAVCLIKDMKFGNSNTYNSAGFSHLSMLGQKRLQYCEHCVQEDNEKHGEPYWHRLHQFPGVLACAKHGTALTESAVEISAAIDEYCPLLPEMAGAKAGSASDMSEILTALACDAEWLLINGCNLGYYEYTRECYDKWLRVKGFRNHNGKTYTKSLAKALVDYYGQELLSLYDAYNSGACTWLRRIIQQANSLQHPMYHILLMHFLAGKADDFFRKAETLTIPEYLPFGAPPYPCRNAVCDYYLQSVIESIDVVSVHGTPRASFICPHCGFTYRRKRNAPKEKWYSGQIDVTDYGWKWHETLESLLMATTSINKTAEALKCDTRTVVRLGNEKGLFSETRYQLKKPYVPKGSPAKSIDYDVRQTQYRQRWIALIAANPGASRLELSQRDPGGWAWLRENDTEWHEQNLPPSRKSQPKWADSDNEYAERIKDAMKQIRDSPGKPRWLSVSAIGKLLNDRKIHRKLASGRLPKSKALIDANAETREDWQRRKLIWAAQDIRERGEVITVYKVRYKARIVDKERKWDEFIHELMQ